jgi:uncharacterized membrane protein
MQVPTKNISDVERALSIVAGSVLAVAAMRGYRKHPLRALSGAAFILRGLSGYCPASAALGRSSADDAHSRHMASDDTRVALGGNRGVLIDECISIERPARQLYAFWRDLRNLPQVFTHLECVDVVNDRTSRWRIAGPLGMAFEWDAHIINDVESEIIAWQSLPGADIVSAGSVTFHERTRAGRTTTDVRVRLQYDAPGGKAAPFLARLAGEAPDALVREQLQRLKEMMEAGSAPLPSTVPMSASATTAH